VLVRYFTDVTNYSNTEIKRPFCNCKKWGSEVYASGILALRLFIYICRSPRVVQNRHSVRTWWTRNRLATVVQSHRSSRTCRWKNSRLTRRKIHNDHAISTRQRENCSTFCSASLLTTSCLCTSWVRQLWTLRMPTRYVCCSWQLYEYDTITMFCLAGL